MTVNNINDPVSPDKKLPALVPQKAPESPLQGGKISLPPQTYCSVVKISQLRKLQAEGAELPAVPEADPFQRQF